MNYVKTSSRWDKFANKFAEFVIKNFKDMDEFCSSTVRGYIRNTASGRKLNEDYKKQCGYSEKRRREYRAWNWDLDEFERVDTWLQLLAREGVLRSRRRKVGEKGFKNCASVYRVATKPVTEKLFIDNLSLLPDNREQAETLKITKALAESSVTSKTKQVTLSDIFSELEKINKKLDNLTFTVVNND